MVEQPSTLSFAPHPLHRPLIGWCVAVLIGAAVGYAFGHANAWLGCAVGFCLLAWVPRLHPRIRSLALCLLLSSLVAWRAGVVNECSAAAFARLNSALERNAPVSLTVTVSPDCRLVQRRRGGPYCRFSADSATFADGTPIRGAMLDFFFYDKSGAFPRPGETWHLSATPRKTSRFTRFAFSVRAPEATRLPRAHLLPALRYRFLPLRAKLARNLTLGIPKPVADSLQALLLGYRNTLPYEERQRYASAGILHIFAISGLHVGIIAAFLIWGLARLRFTLRSQALVLAPILVLYLLLTGVPPSAARACLMAILYALAPTFYRRSNATGALLLTAAVVVLIRPEWVANPGAILSFTVMGGILLFMPSFAYFFECLLCVRPAATPLGSSRPLLRFRQTLASLLALTLSAWIAAAPLSLYYFGRLSFVGLLLNLFIPPLVLVLVGVAALSALVGLLWAPLSIFLNRVAALLMTLLDTGAELALELPGSTLDLTPAQRPGAVLTFLALLILFGLGLELRAYVNRVSPPRP